jgi:hypothetical protein
MSDSAPTAVVDEIEALLQAHELDIGATVRDNRLKTGYSLACTCGVRWEPDRPNSDPHRRHLAEVLATWRIASSN